MRLLELILRRSNVTDARQRDTPLNDVVMEGASGNSVVLPGYGVLLGDSLLTECMPQLGNFLGGSDNCLGFDSITFEGGHTAHTDGPLHSVANKECKTEPSSSALATLLLSNHVLTSGTCSSTSALSLLTPRPGVSVAPSIRSKSVPSIVKVETTKPCYEPLEGSVVDVINYNETDVANEVTFTLDDFETLSLNIVNDPSSVGEALTPEDVNDADDGLNVFHLADREVIDIKNFPLFNLDDALLEKGIDAQDMSSLLEQFEASAEGNASTELLDVVGSPSSISGDSQMAAPCIARAASTTILDEHKQRASKAERKSHADKLLRSSSDDCLRVTSGGNGRNSNAPRKHSNAAKVLAKHVAQTVAITGNVHKSLSENILGRHCGVKSLKIGKHKSKRHAPNRTVSAPTSPAPSRQPSPSRDIIRKITASSQKRKGTIMLTDPLPPKGGRGTRKPLKLTGFTPVLRDDVVMFTLKTGADSDDDDGSLVSDTSVGVQLGGNLSDGQQSLSSASKKISISLYRSRLEERRQRQQLDGTTPDDSGSSGRASPCEVSVNYYDKIADHDYCQNVPLCKKESGDELSVALCKRIASGSIVPRLSEFDINAAMAACSKEKVVGSVTSSTVTSLPVSNVASCMSGVQSGLNGAALNVVTNDCVEVEMQTGNETIATEKAPKRLRRETITDVVDMEIDSDEDNSHHVNVIKAVTKLLENSTKLINADNDSGITNDNDRGIKNDNATDASKKPDVLESIAEKEPDCCSPGGIVSSEPLTSLEQVADNAVVPETCSETSAKEVADFSQRSSEKRDDSTPGNTETEPSTRSDVSAFKPRSSRGRRQNYRRNVPSPHHNDESYFNKVPNYFTALSIQSQITRPIKRIRSGLKLVDSDLPNRDRDPSPDRDAPVYDKLPAYYSCFTNSVRYETSYHGDSLAENYGGSESASNSGYSSRSSSVGSESSCSSRARSVSSSWSRSSRSCSREHKSVHNSRSSWQRQRERRRRSYSSSSRSRSRSSRSRSPRSRSQRSSRSYSRRRSYSRSRSRRSWTRRSRSRERRNQGRNDSRRTRSRSSSEELKSSQRAEAHMRQIEERRIVYVGRIPDDYTKGDLRQRFNRFGVIEDVSVHFREHGDNYGFVTFEYTCDAFAAKENGNKVPDCETFEFCFGGRRHFCRSNYADLDGNMEDEEEMCAVIPKQSKADLDFDALLRQATKKLKTKQR